jgi:hypothetical protein
VRWLKWVGLAGVFGAAAVGVGVAVQQRRQRRRWVDYTPDELRDRLHQRLADSSNGTSSERSPAAPTP